MAKSKLVKVNEKIAENVVGGYKKIEEGDCDENHIHSFNEIRDHPIKNCAFCYC